MGLAGLPSLPARSLRAVAVVVDVALNARPAPVSAGALASRHGLKARQLETVLQDLVRGGLLKSVRGPQGGYALARERRRISVGDILRAVRTDPEAAPAEQASPLLEVVVRPALAAAGEVYLREVDRITVDALCQAAPVPAGNGSTPDFTI